MRAAVFYGPHDVRMTDGPYSRAGAGEAIVKVSIAGICDSEVNRFRYGSPAARPGSWRDEVTGDVAEIGPGVPPAGRPAPLASWSRVCFYCRAGDPRRCVEFVRRGLTVSGTDGGFAGYGRETAAGSRASWLECRRQEEGIWRSDGAS